MKSIPKYENFIPLGFGVSNRGDFSIGNSNIGTGYNMNIIAGPVMKLGETVAKEAYMYDCDDDASHTAKDYVNEAKKFINENIDSVCESYNVNENRDPDSIRKEYKDLKRLSIQSLRDMWLRTYRIGNPRELDKEGLIVDILVAKHGSKYVEAAFESITESEPLNDIYESDEYEYDPKSHAERLDRREEQNLQRYRAAQDRGDNYAIALYELRIKLDKIDKEKLKVLTAIDKLKEKFNKK